MLVVVVGGLVEGRVVGGGEVRVDGGGAVGAAAAGGEGRWWWCGVGRRSLVGEWEGADDVF